LNEKAAIAKIVTENILTDKLALVLHLARKDTNRWFNYIDIDQCKYLISFAMRDASVASVRLIMPSAKCQTSVLSMHIWK